MENVPLVLYSPLWESLLSSLESLGYRNRFGLLDSADFESAQGRVRCFMISKLGDEPPDLPRGTVRPTCCIRDVLDASPDPDLIMHVDPSMVVWRDKVSMRIRAVADLDMPSHMETQRRVYSPAGVSPTITKGDKMKKPKILAGKDEEGRIIIRILSPSECWRLSGFPEWAYEKAAKVSNPLSLYDQAGNTIVVQVLQAIFRAMFVTPSRPQKMLSDFVVQEN